MATLLVCTILVTIRSYFESHHCLEFWIWMNVTNYYNSVINQRQAILYGVPLIYFKRKKGSNWDLESFKCTNTVQWNPLSHEKHTNITADTIIETSTIRYDGQLCLFRKQTETERCSDLLDVNQSVDWVSVNNRPEVE